MKHYRTSFLALLSAILLFLLFPGKLVTLAGEVYTSENNQKGLLALQPALIYDSSPPKTSGYSPFMAPDASPHGYYHSNTASCAACHHTHTNLGEYLQAAWPEEDVCFVCHSTAGSSIFDIQAAFTTSSNSDTAFYSHPVEMTASVHTLIHNETDPSAFANLNRHIECVDCHNPHVSQEQINFPPVLQSAIYGATGVAPVYAMAGSPASFLWLQNAEYEYQVCFKCHSSYTNLPTYPPDGWDGNQVVAGGLGKLTYINSNQVADSRDMAYEFNPYHNSYHPVIAPGTNTHIPPDSFVNGYAADSMIYCADCHGTPPNDLQGDGPHGFMLHILKETSSYITVWSGQRDSLSGGEVCFNCHNYDVYVSGSSEIANTNFRKGYKNLHRSHADNGSCYTCHDSHGSEQLHLINLDTSINNIPGGQLSFQNGYDGTPTNSQTFWQISTDGATKTCFIICHDRPHNTTGKQYPNLFD